MFARVVNLTRARSAARWAAALVAVCGAVAGLTGLLLAHTRPTGDALVAAAVFAPLLIAAAALGAVVGAAARAWVPAALAAAVALAGAGTFGPLYLGGQGGGGGLTVMTANLYLGRADPSALVATVAQHQVDVLTVQELTPEAEAALREAGLEALLPRRVLVPLPGGRGAGVYSVHPLSAARQLPGYLLVNLVVDVQVGAGGPVALFAVHPLPPLQQPGVWSAEQGRLAADLRAAGGRRTVVASGDFNASYAHRQFRDLLALGYADAAEATGAGLVPTYPVDRSFPALVGIDHVLVRGAAVAGLRRVPIAGSDHHGLVADITLPSHGS